MKLKYIYFILISCFIYINKTCAQVNVKDSIVRVSNIQIGVAIHMPQADFAKRFGYYASVGGAYFYKFKSNWLIGADGYFLFGDQVKETNMIDGLRTQNGRIINFAGQFSHIYFFQRGFSSQLFAGKIFPLFGPNNNSGLRVQFGLGLMRHRIKILEEENGFPSLNGNYIAGYDRMAGGPFISQSIGFHHQGSSRVINFYVALETFQGFTKGLRSYQFDLMGPATQNRIDAGIGLRFSWFIPFYKKTGNAFYY